MSRLHPIRGARLVVVPFALTLLLGSVGCQDEDEAPPARPRQVLDSPLAGSWYDGDAAALTATLRGFVAEAGEDRLSDVRAFVLPHAGYRYSGATAACALAKVAGRQFRRVVVMGLSHRFRLENVASVANVTHYRTPLGETPLDLAFIEALRRHPEFTCVPFVHKREHSVHIQLPLLQHVLKDFALVPIVVGDLDRETTRRVADILAGLIDDDTLVVASSDFTHYGESYGYVPFRQDVPKRLRELDLGAWKKIEELDTEGFVAYVDETKTTICGRRPIEILLRMLPEGAQPVLCRYETSGRLTGDYSRSVSYLGIAFRTPWPDRKEKPAVTQTTEPLTPAERQALLELARGAVAYAVEHRDLPTPDELGIELTEKMKQPHGAFVTLRRDGELRGCIGEIHAARPLYKAVMGTAAGAAVRDHRFASVTTKELPDLDLHISVLTPPRQADGWQEIVLGRHGIVLQKDGRTATFLPQVAPEQGWDLETTLTRLSMKAGLPADAWREGASFLLFEAEVFGEHDQHAEPEPEPKPEPEPEPEDE